MSKGPKWDQRPYFVRLKLFLSDEVLTCEFPITKYQLEDCMTLETQKRHNRLNPDFEHATKACLMRDYRLYRRYLHLLSLGPIIPFEDIRIVSFGRLTPNQELQGETVKFV
jgi:hypothetical protein